MASSGLCMFIEDSFILTEHGLHDLEFMGWFVWKLNWMDFERYHGWQLLGLACPKNTEEDQ